MQRPDQSDSPNRDQIDYWNSEAAKKWVAFEETIDQVFGPVTRRLLERAAPKAGERVLEVGCGGGVTTMAIARRVGAEGGVLGIDVSEPLLARAKARREAERLEQIDYLLADAQTHAFEAERFDLLASRFGVMFFADPVAAFANMARALRPGGRLAFACWPEMAMNPWFSVPRAVAIKRLGEPTPQPPRAPGPMAFADQDYLLSILTDAGFVDCRAEVEEIGLFHPGTVEEVAFFASNLGPSARIVREFNGTPDDVREIAGEVTEAFRQYVTDEGVSVPTFLTFASAVKASA